MRWAARAWGDAGRRPIGIRIRRRRNERCSPSPCGRGLGGRGRCLQRSDVPCAPPLPPTPSRKGRGRIFLGLSAILMPMGRRPLAAPDVYRGGNVSGGRNPSVSVPRNTTISSISCSVSAGAAPGAGQTAGSAFSCPHSTWQVVELADAAVRRARIPASRVGVAAGIEGHRLAQRMEPAVVEERLPRRDIAQRRRQNSPQYSGWVAGPCGPARTCPGRGRPDRRWPGSPCCAAPRSRPAHSR